MHTKRLLLLALAGNLAVSQAGAEISGSGSPRAFCASGEITGSVTLDQATPGGLAGVVLTLDEDSYDIHLSAVTDADGAYAFTGLCGSLYEIAIQDDTVPTDLMLTGSPAFDGGDGVIILSANDALRTDVDFVFSAVDGSQCSVTIDATCAGASLTTEHYQCNKPLSQLSMRWNGDRDVRVIAHDGKEDDPVIAQFDSVSPGDVVTVGGMYQAPRDVEWEILDAVTGQSLGLSSFHMECDDAQMDGPEDCLTPQGDGRDDKDERVNDWLLLGMQDASGAVDCNPPVQADTCSFQAAGASCDTVDNPTVLTLRYTGGDCASSSHGQGDLHCHGDIDASTPVTLDAGNDNLFVAATGDMFTLGVDGSEADLKLSNDGGERHLKFKTDCSKPLATGDSFGGLQVVAINGQGDSAPVDFAYRISNAGEQVTVELQETVDTLGVSQVTVPAQGSATLYGSAWLSDTATNTVTATVQGDSGCSAVDLVTAVVEAPPTCDVTEIVRQLHDKELRWTLQAGSVTAATIERVEVSWPGAAGKLKEAKLDGNKFYDTEVSGPGFVIDASNMVGDRADRTLPRHQAFEFKLSFQEDIESAPGNLAVTVHFEQGCALSW